MKYFILCFPLFCLSLAVPGQDKDSLTLQACYQMARTHYPVLQQDTLLQRQLTLALKNLDTRYLPHLSLQAQATYQSDVTTIPLKLPGINIPEVAKDQYKAVVDVQQLIFDGGSIKKQKELERIRTRLSLQQQKISFHQLKQLLANWYTDLLVTQAKIKAIHLQQINLTEQLKQTDAAIKKGVALPAQSDELQVALLQTGQQLQSLDADYQAGMKALSLITGKTIDSYTYLVLPGDRNIATQDSIHRPELTQFSLQNELYGQQAVLLGVQKVPALNLFVQGGYGRPGLNMLNNQFDWFYMAGIRLRWNFWDWHEQKRKRQSLQMDIRRVQLEKENFILTTQVALERALAAIHSLEQNIRKDSQIVALRHRIRETASSQLAHGTITPTEYLIKLNDETSAGIQQQTNIIRLRMAKINYQLLKDQ